MKSVNRNKGRLISISSAVGEEVSYDLSIQDALARGYANTSALARLLAPRVSIRLGRNVKIESIITALKRLRGRYVVSTEGIRKVIAESIVNVRTHVSKISVEKTRKSLQLVGAMLSAHREDFIQVSQSISSITLIFDQRVHNEIKKELSTTLILEEGSDYAAIIVQSPLEIINTPGCLVNFYSQLARRHINIEDTVSCYTDTIIVVKMREVGKAFEALTQLINEESEKLRMRHLNKLSER